MRNPFIQNAVTASVFGWLTPSGKFHKSPQWCHLEQLKSIPEVAERIPEAEKLWQSVESAYEGCQELADSGEHGEWHRYEMTLSDSEADLRRLLIERGFIRVGTIDGSLCFEGSGQALANQLQRCKDMAEQHGLAPIFERQTVRS